VKHKSHFKPILIIMVATFIIAILIPPPRTLAQPNLNIFGMEDGNRFVYDDSTTETVEKLDPASYYPREYWVRTYKNNNLDESDMYGISGGELKLWSVYASDMTVAMAFDNGLTVAWHPLSVGEEKTSSANVGNYPGGTITFTAKVIAYEQVPLSFDTLKAYKICITMTASQEGRTSTGVTNRWFAPYLGFVKSESSGTVEKLISFVIGGGTITQETDADSDGLKDYEELIKYGTDRLKADTDGDGCKDGPEVFGGRNPNLRDPGGDVNNDCAINLQDVILSLKLLAGMDTFPLLQSGRATLDADVNGDGKIGMAEVIFIIQKAAEIR
jgi:hypothetical protein